MAGFKIGEFASAAGVGRDTIRHYERIGLLPAAVRNRAGYRVYGEEDLERLQFIRLAQESGFNLEQIRQLLEASTASHERVVALLGVTRAKLDAAKGKIDRLSQVEQVLANLSNEPASTWPQPLWTRLQTRPALAERPA
ncbi:MAG: MerR family transcriptional regulator [Sphingomonadales bacterium]|nr:MerR family transcriptional regulator [Sphingomonadaceae bacterium]MBS3931093.1 MerR family transcriptional regulator [Sphingomonadales bacterium]